MKTDCILIDFDMIFPMQSSDFTISLNFGSILKKKICKENVQIFIFYEKIEFYKQINNFSI